MTQPRKEQINILRAYWTVFNYTATGGTTSTVIAAGTLQPSTVTQTSGGNPSTTPPIRGIITTGSGGFVRLRKVDTALSLDDVGAQIFGRLTFSAGNYTITYKKINGGVEVSATLPGVGSYSVEMLLPEVMNFSEIPANADILYGSSQELLPSGNTIAGDLVVAGNTTLGDATSDTITLNARFISDLIPTPDNTRSLGTSALRWADGNFTQISLRADNTNSIKSIYNASGITATGTSYSIDGNSSINIGTSTTTGITIGKVGITTVINGSLNPTGATTIGGVLTVNGSPSVFNGDVNITGTLTVGNISFVDLTVSGNTILGDNSAIDSVNFSSRIISDFDPKFSDLYDLGATDLRWKALHSTRVEVHADDINSIYALLDSDSLLSTTSFDIDGYSSFFLGATYATDIHIGHSGVTTTVTNRLVTNGSRNLKVTSITSDHPIATGEHCIMVENISVPITVTLPASPSNGDIYIIKDARGNATLFPITILPSGDTIDGYTSLVINHNYGSAFIVFDSSANTWATIAGSGGGSGGGTGTTITPIKTSLYTAVIGDLVRCDPSGAGFTVNLPTAAGNVNNAVVVKNVTSSTNTITIDAFGSETIDGSLTQVISIGFQALTFVSDGTNWIII
ncbi:MAG TPA: hypothetical protein VM577_04405 [Anaerovoracaceae bacterium]|nr:hypothetical protein [Anaerovoracaceae bacterium]